MNELQIFNSEEFGNIRTAEIDGKPYFVGTDVAKVLDITIPEMPYQGIARSRETRHPYI